VTWSAAQTWLISPNRLKLWRSAARSWPASKLRIWSRSRKSCCAALRSSGGYVRACVRACVRVCVCVCAPAHPPMCVRVLVFVCQHAATAALGNSAETHLSLPVLKCMTGTLTVADCNALSQLLVMCLCDKPTHAHTHYTD